MQTNYLSHGKLLNTEFHKDQYWDPYFFLIYINDLPASIRKIAKSIIFADDTSIVVTNDNKVDFRQNLCRVMIEISNWFQCNRLTLNCSKTHFLQFLTKKQNEMQHQIVT